MKLTPQQVEQFYARKLTEGTSAYSVWYCHGALNHALNDALRLGLVYSNVVSLIKPPRVPKHEMAFLTVTQAQALLAVANGDRLETLLVLALATGMREGELLALRWDDVDFERASVLVRANLMHTRKTIVRDETKTGHSRERIALLTLAVNALRHHRARQAEERLRYGKQRVDRQLVFANTRGEHTVYPTCSRAGFTRC